MSVLDNRELIEKATTTVATLNAGGLKQEQQAQQLMIKAMDASKVMDVADIMTMDSNTRVIDQVTFGGRIMRRGQEGTQLADADRAVPDFDKRELTSKLFKAQVDMTEETLEDNIEGDQLKDTIIDLMGKAVGRDSDELLINADTAIVGDPFLSAFDGMLKAATANNKDALGSKLTPSVLRDVLKVQPTRFKSDFTELCFFTHQNALIDYNDIVSTRATELGDRALRTGSLGEYSMVPIKGVPLFPDDLGGNQTALILTHPDNLKVGIQRQVKFRVWEDPRADKFFIIATLRMDFLYAIVDAVSKGINIAV